MIKVFVHRGQIQTPQEELDRRLFQALDWSDQDAVREAIASGADIGALDGEACTPGKPLLPLKGGVQAGRRVSGRTPLSRYVLKHAGFLKPEILKMLFEAGAEPNQRVSPRGATVFSTAFNRGRGNLLQLRMFLDAGANPKTRNRRGDSVLIEIIDREVRSVQIGVSPSSDVFSTMNPLGATVEFLNHGFSARDLFANFTPGSLIKRVLPDNKLNANLGGFLLLMAATLAPQEGAEIIEAVAGAPDTSPFRVVNEILGWVGELTLREYRTGISAGALLDTLRQAVEKCPEAPFFVAGEAGAVYLLQRAMDEDEQARTAALRFLKSCVGNDLEKWVERDIPGSKELVEKVSSYLSANAHRGIEL